MFFPPTPHPFPPPPPPPLSSSSTPPPITTTIPCTPLLLSFPLSLLFVLVNSLLHYHAILDTTECVLHKMNCSDPLPR